RRENSAYRSFRRAAISACAAPVAAPRSASSSALSRSTIPLTSSSSAPAISAHSRKSLWMLLHASAHMARAKPRTSSDPPSATLPSAASTSSGDATPSTYANTQNKSRERGRKKKSTQSNCTRPNSCRSHRPHHQLHQTTHATHQQKF
ncbi:hypothetical protein TcCL_Unassigned03214, partial [Trypanosoma cruzi]